MTNRLRCPLAQTCQRARAKPSQPRKAMTPGTRGRFILDHSDGLVGPSDLSSCEVEVSCNREPPPGRSQREGANCWPGGRSLPERRHTLCQAAANAPRPHTANYEPEGTWWLPCRE